MEGVSGDGRKASVCGSSASQRADGGTRAERSLLPAVPLWIAAKSTFVGIERLQHPFQAAFAGLITPRPGVFENGRNIVEAINHPPDERGNHDAVRHRIPQVFFSALGGIHEVEHCRFDAIAPAESKCLESRNQASVSAQALRGRLLAQSYSPTRLAGAERFARRSTPQIVWFSCFHQGKGSSPFRYR